MPGDVVGPRVPPTSALELRFAGLRERDRASVYPAAAQGVLPSRGAAKPPSARTLNPESRESGYSPDYLERREAVAVER